MVSEMGEYRPGRYLRYKLAAKKGPQRTRHQPLIRLLMQRFFVSTHPPPSFPCFDLFLLSAFGPLINLSGQEVEILAAVALP
jgi:hypothetical protein